MAERPILFSSPMVRAILEGRKTQTRRVVKPQPYLDTVRPEAPLMWKLSAHHAIGNFNGTVPEEFVRTRCPYGAPGDTLWVRETFGVRTYPTRMIEFAADCDLSKPSNQGCWKPAIHLPRALSRLSLRVLSVRVERLQSITEADARAEGVEPLESRAHETRETFDRAQCEQCGGLRLYTSFGADGGAQFDTDCGKCDTHAKRFRNLWDSINTKRAPWSSNPWVFVVAFERVAQAVRT